MNPADTDGVPLDALPRVRVPRQWRRTFETTGIVACLFFGGFGTGFVYSARSAENQIAQIRVDHLRELERLTEAHQFSISSLTRSTVRAADSAAVASEQATAAVEAVGEVAKKVDRNTPTKKAP
jgi:hypothetical protein